MEMGVQDMSDPPGGEIKRDDKGNPSCLMSEAAGIMFVCPHLAKVASMEQKLTAIRGAIKTYQAVRYTRMTEMAMDENGWEALMVLRSKEELTIRLAIYWLTLLAKQTRNTSAKWTVLLSCGSSIICSHHRSLRIAGIKVIGEFVFSPKEYPLLKRHSLCSVSGIRSVNNDTN